MPSRRIRRLPPPARTPLWAAAPAADTPAAKTALLRFRLDFQVGAAASPAAAAGRIRHFASGGAGRRATRRDRRPARYVRTRGEL